MTEQLFCDCGQPLDWYGKAVSRGVIQCRCGQRHSRTRAQNEVDELQNGVNESDVSNEDDHRFLPEIDTGEPEVFHPSLEPDRIRDRFCHRCDGWVPSRPGACWHAIHFFMMLLVTRYWFVIWIVRANLPTRECQCCHAKTFRGPSVLYQIATAPVIFCCCAIFFLFPMMFAGRFSSESRSQAHFQQGYEAHQSEQYLQAVSHYSAAIEFVPDFSEAIFNRSLCYQSLGEIKNGLNDLNRYLALNPADGKSFAKRAELHRSLGMQREAINDFGRAIELISHDDKLVQSCLLIRAHLYIENDQIEKSLDDLTAVLQQDPQSVDALALRGAVLREEGQLDRSLQDLNEAVEMSDGLADVLYERAKTWSAKEDYENALIDIQRVIAFDPRDADAQHELGHVLTGLQQHEKAIKAFDLSIKLDPFAGHYYGCRGFAYRSLSEPAKAVDDFTKYMDLDGKTAEILFHRALSYLQMGHPRLARKDALEAREFIRKGKDDELLEDINNLLDSLSPNKADVGPTMIGAATPQGHHARFRFEKKV